MNFIHYLTPPPPAKQAFFPNRHPQTGRITGVSPTQKPTFSHANPTTPPKAEREAGRDTGRDAGRRAEREEQRRAELAAAPYVAATVLSTGIHPATSRMVGLHMATYSPDGEVVDTYFCVFNPGDNPGPRHLHSLTPEDIEQGVGFETQLRQICAFIDGRTLIVHNSTRDWGFIVAESRRAVRVLNSKGPRSRGQRRGQRGRRRRIGHIPRPEMVVDTLESARRRQANLPDTRLRAVARALGMRAPSPKASVARAAIPAEQLARENTLLLGRMFFNRLRDSDVVQASPNDLRGDRFGLQRSRLRLDAATATRRYTNPGMHQPGKELVQGMEVVITPDITVDPDEIIATAMDAGLAYSEQLTRETSLVVCNQEGELRGKAMHARRKGIPLVSDTEFMQLTQNVRAGTAE